MALDQHMFNSSHSLSPMIYADGYRVEGTSSSSSSSIPERNVGGDALGVLSQQETRDILEILPLDPFGMDSYSEFEIDYRLFFWNNGVIRLRAFPGYTGFKLYMNMNVNVPSVFAPGYASSSSSSHVDSFMTGFDSQTRGFVGGGSSSVSHEEEIISGIPNSDSTSNVDDAFLFFDAMDVIGCWHSKAAVKGSGTSSSSSSSTSDGETQAQLPHPAIEFALRCLGVRDLLSVERVCSSLHSAIKNDPLLWRSIRIESPLHEKITDDVLLQLTNRAQGNLQCLSLEDCTRITDDGLKRVLDSNPRLMKLSVPGCTRLSIDGVVKNIKAFNSMMGTQQGLKYLRVGGLFGVTHAHFEELKLLLGIDSEMPQLTHKPHFFTGTKAYLSLEDDRALDVEMCPRCQNMRLVYDCPTKICQAKEVDDALGCCRACTLCIARCFDCGRCVNGSEYEEMFCLESVCSDCLKQHAKCQEGQDSDLHKPHNMEIIHHG
ncbi:hypothetical protein ACFE04_024790 [Oxalis oulophora]